MKDRSILKPEEFEKLKGTAEAHQYRFDEKRNLYIKQIRLIRGLVSAKKNATCYALATKVGIHTMLLSKDGRLTFDEQEAKVFYDGFDDPEIRKQIWETKIGIKFYYYKLLKHANRKTADS